MRNFTTQWTGVRIDIIHTIKKTWGGWGGGGRRVRSDDTNNFLKRLPFIFPLDLAIKSAHNRWCCVLNLYSGRIRGIHIWCVARAQWNRKRQKVTPVTAFRQLTFLLSSSLIRSGCTYVHWEANIFSSGEHKLLESVMRAGYNNRLFVLLNRAFTETCAFVVADPILS